MGKHITTIERPVGMNQHSTAWTIQNQQPFLLLIYLFIYFLWKGIFVDFLSSLSGKRIMEVIIIMNIVICVFENRLEWLIERCCNICCNKSTWNLVSYSTWMLSYKEQSSRAVNKWKHSPMKEKLLKNPWFSKGFYGTNDF